MKDESKTKEQLLSELAELRQRIAELEKAETERKRAEEALRESEEKFRNIIQSLPMGVHMYQLEPDGQLRFIGANPAADEILGVDNTQYIGKTIEEAFPAIVETEIPERFRTIAEKGGFWKKEDIVYEDELIGGVFENYNFQTSCGKMASLFIEITERKGAEEALREAEERFRTIIEAAPSVLLVCDAEGNNIYVSPSCEEITGYTQEELLGRVVFWVHEDDIPRVKEVYDRTFRQAVGCKEVEYKAVKKNGELWYGSSSWEPIKDTEGKLQGVVFQTVDITERKRAEEEIHRLSRFLDSVIDNANVWLDVLDEKANVVIWNRAAEEISGYSRQEVVGHGKIWEWLYPDEEYRKEITARAAAIIKRGEVVEDFETTIRRKDGQTRIISWNSRNLVDEKGTPIGSIALGRDITERKQAEEALKEHSERLEEMVEERTKELRDAQEELVRKERLAILGQLAGGVGHELRNPLGVISNAVYYLQTILPDADQTTKEYLEMISSEVSHGEKIVSDLLDLSRTKPAEREEIAVSDLVARLLEKQPPPEKVKVTTRIAPDLPPAFVDPQQIGQVLVNLVTNAYEAMPEGGRLTVKAKAEGNKAYLSITDTGCGIPQENMERLFEPLFTTKAKGIGLGLAVSKTLVEANEGSIEVESKEGKGSTFTVILPTKEAQA